MSEQEQPFLSREKKEKFEPLEVENKTSSKCCKQPPTVKTVLYYILVTIKYLLFLYFGPLIYTISHEFGHAMFAAMFQGCRINIHIGCLEECKSLIFHISDFFYLHTILPFYGYALTNENCRHPLSTAQDVVSSMAGSTVGAITIYLLFSTYFTWFRWKALPINFSYSRTHALRNKLRESSKFGFSRAIFPFQNISDASEWKMRVSEENEPILIFTSYELYCSIVLFGIAVSAVFDRLLYGYFPYSGFAILPTFLWNGINDIWGDGADWWIALGASKGSLIAGACISFILVWIARALTLWRAVKAILVVRKRTISTKFSSLNI